MQHYIANLMLVQCVIAIHAEVWTFQFGWKFYQKLTVAMVQVPEGTAVSTQGQHYVQYKKVMMTKDAPLSSHLADYIL